MRKGFKEVIFVKKLISAIIVVCFSLALATTALAATTDTDTPPAAMRYTHIDLLSAGLSINSSGKASCGGIVHATYPDTDITLKVELQQYKNNTWSTIKSWSDSGSGKNTLDVNGEYYVTSGYTYRVVSTAKVYNSNGILLEEQSKTTSEKKY